MRQGQHMGNRCQPLWQRIPQPLPQRDQRQEMPLGAAVWGRNKSSAKSYAKAERMVNVMRRATSGREAAKA